MLQSHLPAGLSEFVSAAYPPVDDGPVLCICEAPANSGAKYELITARYVANKRSWRTLDGAWPINSILGWKNAHRWLQAL